MIVKKLIAAIMIFTLLLTCVQPCFAATISDTTDFVPNPLEMGLTVGVNARKSGTADGYGLAFTLDNVYSDGTGGGVDYQATLDMAPIRKICTGAFISNVVQNNPDLKAEFDDAPVATTVKAIIEYPASAIVGDLASAGVLSAGDIFSEVSRNIESGKVTITYKNDENVTAKDLVDNVNTHLKDITFTLEDGIAYSEAGSHIVSVTLSGSTTISFSSKTQVIEYNGQASHVTNVTMGDMTQHKLSVVPAVPATCLTPGTTEGIICSTCNRYDCGADGIKEPDLIPALNHKAANGDSLKIHIDGELATCTATGIIEHWTCPLCKCDFEHIGAPGVSNGVAGDVVKEHADFIIAKIPHTLDTADTHVDATCSTPGYTDGKYCKVCGITIQAPTLVPATGIHSSAAIGTAKAATCTVDGITAGEKCSVCNIVLVPQVIIPATGHDFGDWTIVRNADEFTEGKKERECKNGCGTKEEVVIPKVEHTHVIDPKMDVITKAPTCTTAGKKQQYCGCGTAVGAEVAVPATGHKLSHVDAVEANCVAKGKEEHYTCVNGCGQNFRDSQAKYKLNSINTSKDKSNHVEIITLKGFAATCEKDGLTDGEKCKACNTVTTKQEKISKKTASHKLVTVPETAATCERNGAEEHKHCEICNADFDMAGTNEIKEKDFRIPAIGHDYGTPYLSADPPVEVGRDYYKAFKKCENTVCDVPGGKIVETRIHKTDACSHTILVGENETSTYVIETIVKPTCTEKGKGRKICSICGNIESTNIDIEPLGHTYEWVEQVNATCHKKGTAGHYKCKTCGKLFDSEKREISKPRELDKITEHRYQRIDSETEQCYYCGEKMKVKKKDKDGNDAPGLGVNVEKPSHIKQADTDREREDITKNGKDVQSVESNIIIEEREEASDKIDEKIHSKKKTEDTIVEKLVFDIVVEKVITYDSGDVDREVYKETSDFVVIKINIPPGMRNKESFIVHRHHIAENGTESFDEIRESSDNTKERIEVAPDKSYITLYVKKFSEYAVAAYSTEVPPTPETTGSSGGGSSSYTIKLNVNGGVVLNNIAVKRGEKVELPIPTRDGYVFAGWYTDSTFNTPFDANTAINRNYVLYAKWVEAGECEGTIEDNCPCLKYNDLNPELWYHEGVDYVLNNGMMIGTSDKTFEPDASVTRAMLVTIIWRAENKPEATKDSSFKDLEDGLYYVDAVEWAAENGIVNGYSETEFAPNDIIAREQIAAIMFRYAGYKGYDVAVGENTNILSYTDYSQISEYAIPAMQWAAGIGLMTGRTNSTLNPKAETTRAETATIIKRFYSDLGL